MYVESDRSGIASYAVTSRDDGDSPQLVRVLAPTAPARGVPHNFLYVLPVEAGWGTLYGDGIKTLLKGDAQNKYNVTIVEPTFPVEPWYANNPTNPDIQYETFMADDLVPWVTRNFATTGDEQNWLVGFSKSGLGAQDLILKHPNVFTEAASWDFPADMDNSTTDLGQQVGDGLNYGTNANFQANYRLTPSFVRAHSGPFRTEDRIWIGSYSFFGSDVADYNALLTTEGIEHMTETPQQMRHRWDSGWVPIALAALSEESAALPPGP
jgi:S-formylglutathione hydrolase FrmB